jgi:iron complex transport system substrate-binding protein
MRKLFALTLLGALAWPAPASAEHHVASVNLCTDELLLLLASPSQIASVSHLSQQPQETPFWRQARRYKSNDGTLLSVLQQRPDVVLTMGGRGHDRQRIAKRLGIRTVELPYPQTIDDVIASVRLVARTLDRPGAGEKVVASMVALKRTAPSRRLDALYLSGGGLSVSANGLAADWMRLAGLQQRSLRGDRVTLEQLLVAPPSVLLRSNYRSRQYSREQQWLAHPLASRAKARLTLQTDGRLWTCMGPSLVREIPRLRRMLQS